MTEIHWTEIDNVTTIWVDTPGPLRTGLLFGTGRAGESLTTSGHTHLIEHIALSSINPNTQAQPHNGFVTGAITAFITMGSPQSVSDFLTKLCSFLAELPGDRLENEKQVLIAESSARPYDFRANFQTRRYGASGYGLMGLPELGLRNATLQQLREFSAKRFTKENAILWFSGEPPANLHLNLPNGTKLPSPTIHPLSLPYPCWFVDEACGGVAASFSVPRIPASTIYCEIAANRLRERLRMNHAVSYSPMVLYEPLNADTSHLVLFADSERERRTELSNHFGEIVAGLVNFNETEVETARQQVQERWSGTLAPPPADRKLAEIQRAAMEWIFGKEFESLDAIAANLSNVKAEDVVKFGRDIQSTALYAVPNNVSAQIYGNRKHPSSLTDPVKGKKTLHLDAPIQPEWLVHGGEGISVVWPDNSHLTVRFSDIAAALHYDDGCICLISSDATVITIEPTLWQNGQSVCSQIRGNIPEQFLLGQPTRAAESLPKPRTTAWERFRARLSQK